MFLKKYNGRSPYWQIIFKINGKRTSKSTKTADRQKAERILELFKSNYPDENIFQVIESKIENTVLLKDFKNEYVPFMKGYASASYVQRSIEPAFRELNKFVGDIPLKEISGRMLEQFLLSIFKRSKYTAANYYRTLKSAFNKAHSWNYIDKNYLNEFRLPKIQGKGILFITFEDLLLIIQKLAYENIKKLVLFAFLTGLRCGEIVSLRWTQINFEKKVMQIGSDSFETKSKKIRFIPISKPVFELLTSIKPPIIYTKNNYVFHKCNGLPFTVGHISKQFKSGVRAAKVNPQIHFHTLRSSFGSYLLQRGVPISSISALLGHSSISVTEKHYSALTIGNLFEAINHFDQLNITNN